MAQTILCDYEGCGREHDLIVSMHANGDTAAWCFEHAAFWCQVYLAQWEEANPPQDAPEPEPEPEPEDAGEPAMTDLEREQLGQPMADEPHTPPDPGVTEVVKRGTSPSRRRHEAKRREKARQAVEPADSQ